MTTNQHNMHHRQIDHGDVAANMDWVRGLLGWQCSAHLWKLRPTDMTRLEENPISARVYNIHKL